MMPDASPSPPDIPPLPPGYLRVDTPQGAFSYPNIVTGLKRGVAGISGFPQFAAQTAGNLAHGFGVSPPGLDWLAQNLPTSQQALNTFAPVMSDVRQRLFGSPATPIYEPQTPGERIVQAGVSGAVPAAATLPLLAAAGAPVAAAALPQLIGGMAGPATSQTLAEAGAPILGTASSRANCGAGRRVCGYRDQQGGRCGRTICRAELGGRGAGGRESPQF
jgi:hypothetical protein